MIREIGHAYSRVLVRWMDTVRRLALPVVIVAVVTTTSLIYYTVCILGINTDTASLLSEELPFLRTYQSYQQAFPQFTDFLIIVIEGDNPDLAEDAARGLYDRLSALSALFHYIYYPAGHPFFADNGLLYLDTNDLAELSERLADAQPLLATLAEDPSLRGLFDVLGLALEEVIDGEAEPDRLQLVLDSLGDAVLAQREGRFHYVSWRDLMRGEPDEPDEMRHFILAQPKLDFADLQPAEPAIAAIRRAAQELDLDPAAGVRVRLTGPAALSHEELQSVKSGAGLAGMISLGLVSVLLIVGLGSWRLVIATLLTLIMGLVWTAAFTTVAIGHLNLISVAFTVLFIGLAVDFGIHFSLRYREQIRHGNDHGLALRETAAAIGGALTLGAMAAAAGFYAFVPSAFVGLSELGIISGTGMFIALIANLTVLPALLTCMRLRLGASRAPVASVLAGEMFVRRHARSVVLGQ